MECERLTKLIKSWYIQVKEEALAPARMVEFMRAHLAGCPICLSDPAVESEVKRIIEMVLPAAKIPKTVPKEEGVDYDEEEVAEGETEDGQVDDEEDQPDDTLDDDEDIDELEDDDDDI